MKDSMIIGVAMLILYVLSCYAYIKFVNKYNTEEDRYDPIAKSLYIANICSLVLAVFAIFCIIINIVFG